MGFEEVHVGIDLGQRTDPSAICVASVERRLMEPVQYERTTPSDPRSVHAKTETVYRIQHIERLPLGMSYPDQVAYIVKLLVAIQAQQIALRERIAEIPLPPRVVYLDSTGCGIPVTEMLNAAIRREPKAAQCSFYPLMFTAGMTFDKFRRPAGTLGKAYLVSRLEALSQARPSRIKVPDPRDPDGATIDPRLAREVEAMLSELHDYRRDVSQDGHDTYGAPIGRHDDLATALGLACLEDSGSGVTYGKVVY